MKTFLKIFTLVVIYFFASLNWVNATTTVPVYGGGTGLYSVPANTLLVGSTTQKLEARSILSTILSTVQSILTGGYDSIFGNSFTFSNAPGDESYRPGIDYKYIKT